MQLLMKVLIRLILPLVAFYLLFSMNALLGWLFMAAYIGYCVYSVRAGIFEWLANVKYNTGEVNKALAWLNKAYKSGKAKSNTVITYAYLLLKMGNMKEAEEILNSLLNTKLSEEDRMLAKSNIALILWKKGKVGEAVEMLEEVHKNYKSSALYGSLGFFLVLKGDLKRALEFNLEAYDYNDKSHVIMDNLGNTYYLLGKTDKAEEIYKKLLERKPAFPEAYYNYSLVLLKKNEPVHAVDMMKKSLQHNFSFLSTITKEEVEAKISETEKLL